MNKNEEKKKSATKMVKTKTQSVGKKKEDTMNEQKKNGDQYKLHIA